MSRKLLNMEFGTFITTPEGISLSLPKQQFNSSFAALNHTVKVLSGQPDFLDITNAEETADSYVLTYSAEYMEFRNLKTVHREPPAVRLSIAKKIMEQDILSHFDGYVSIAPANIWYMPMRTVKYAYRGNFNMPSTEQDSNLVRYKALLLYILIGYSYERALRREYRISEKKNPFALQIVNADTIAQLARLVTEQEDFVLAQNMAKQRTGKRIVRAAAASAVALLIVSNIVTYFATSNYMAVAADAAVMKDLEDTKAELSDILTQTALEDALAKDDFNAFAKIMAEAGSTPQEIAGILFEHNQYNLALEHYPDMLEPVLQRLYNDDEAERILMLQLPSHSSQELMDKLSLEQAVVSYNTTTIDAKWVFNNDRYTLTRIAEAYVHNSNRFTASNVAARLESLGFSSEAVYINSLVDVASLNADLYNAKQNLEEATGLPETDENRANRITEAENNINVIQDNLNTATDSIISAKEVMDDNWQSESESP